MKIITSMLPISIAINLLLFVLFSSCCLGQDKQVPYPEVGRYMPDFHFNDVRHYSEKQASLDSFKGKWLVLDFWNRYCGTCLDKMPIIDSLQNEFSKNVQFLLVGYTGSQYATKFRKGSDNLEIRRLFERIRKERKLGLSIAYDSLLFHRFKIGACPYMVIVSPDGIVRGITYSVTRSELTDLINGKQVTLPKAYRKNERAE